MPWMFPTARNCSHTDRWHEGTGVIRYRLICKRHSESLGACKTPGSPQGTDLPPGAGTKGWRTQQWRQDRVLPSPGTPEGPQPSRGGLGVTPGLSLQRGGPAPAHTASLPARGAESPKTV